ILLSGHDTATIHAIADDVVELGAVHTGVIGRTPLRTRSGMSSSPQSNGGPASIVRVAMAPEMPFGRETDSGDSALRPSEGQGAVAVRSRTVELVAEPVLRGQDIAASIDGHEVLADIDFVLPGGAALAVVGASGAGKTTLARVVAGLHRAATGSLELRSESIPIGPRRRDRNGRNGIQLVTQNPLSALNPRRTVAQTLGRPLRRIGGVPKRLLAQRITDLLDSVELAPELAIRYPHELSGGQRQRVALARALAAEPAVLVCDEITSALDHDTAVSIMTLLDRIRAEHDTGLLVITHDMTLVTGHCSHLVVLDHGRIVESGSATAVLTAPAHTATRELLG
ncbi:ATP-binding cassette domain-containing protein, partial [Nocardia pseudovaccinii]|uniref:ATP-binding cassette domain-containing protein n=1 Tax=Nocardia pseudovaccinii TaxID=189540 RepID=UPI000B238A09